MLPNTRQAARAAAAAKEAGFCCCVVSESESRLRPRATGWARCRPARGRLGLEAVKLCPVKLLGRWSIDTDCMLAELVAGSECAVDALMYLGACVAALRA